MNHIYPDIIVYIFNNQNINYYNKYYNLTDMLVHKYFILDSSSRIIIMYFKHFNIKIHKQ